MNNIDFRKKYIDPELVRFAGITWRQLCKRMPNSRIKIRFYPNKNWKLIGSRTSDRLVPKKAYVSGRLEACIVDENKNSLKEYNLYLSGKILFVGGTPKLFWDQPVSSKSICSELTRC